MEKLMLLVCLLYLVSAEPTSQEERQAILEYHNKMRGSVQPAASDMLKMRYDIRLEKLAADWVERCIYDHPNPDIYTEYQGVGQNLAIIGGKKPTMPELAEKWYDEYHDFNYAENSCASGKVCGHYTQLVWAKSDRLGCAVKRCDGTKPDWTKPVYLMACQYEPQGNYIGQKPYESGESCSACPGEMHCSQNLCTDGSPDFMNSLATKPFFKVLTSFILSCSLLLLR